MQIGKDASECQTAGRELTFRVTQLEEQIGALQTEKELLRAAKRTSATSSQPPSQDSERIQAESPEQKRQETRGQAGHEGHGRELYPIEECHSITDLPRCVLELW